MSDPILVNAVRLFRLLLLSFLCLVYIGLQGWWNDFDHDTVIVALCLSYLLGCSGFLMFKGSLLTKLLLLAALPPSCFLYADYYMDFGGKKIYGYDTGLWAIAFLFLGMIVSHYAAARVNSAREYLYSVAGITKFISSINIYAVCIIILAIIGVGAFLSFVVGNVYPFSWIKEWI